MNKTGIEWTNYSANPLKYRDAAGNVVWGCVHASQGCMRCYSEQLAKRYGKGGPFDMKTMSGLTPFLDENELHKMLTYKPAAGKMCFVGDMTDIFGEWVSDELIDRLFAVFALRRDVTWQVLTKRAQRLPDYCHRFAGPWSLDDGSPLTYGAYGHGPLPNVWMGVSAEDQKNADERIVPLLATPAAVRFVSYEPALGPIDWKWGLVSHSINWVIVGGESGPRARPFNVEWARSTVRQCKAAGVPVFVKQMGSAPEIQQGCGDCDRCLYKQPCCLGYNVGLELKDRKGGDPSEWPSDLRVRQFPASYGAEGVA